MVQDNDYKFIQTPQEVAKELISLVKYEPGDIFYEPFRGDGAFYDLMPEPKLWSEVREGKDFFEFDRTCNHIITNPPWRGIQERRITLHDIALRCFHIARKSVNLLLSFRALNFLTPNRLEEYQKMGWAITGIHILNVKKWHGRYFFVQFRKGRKSIVSWSRRFK